MRRYTFKFSDDLRKGFKVVSIKPHYDGRYAVLVENLSTMSTHENTHSLTENLTIQEAHELTMKTLKEDEDGTHPVH